MIGKFAKQQQSMIKKILERGEILKFAGIWEAK
jgi:hypothetical protein